MAREPDGRQAPPGRGGPADRGSGRRDPAVRRGAGPHAVGVGRAGRARGPARAWSVRCRTPRSRARCATSSRRASTGWGARERRRRSPRRWAASSTPSCSPRSCASPGAAREDLEVLRGAGLIQRKRRQRDSVMVFEHALVRDAAYDSLPPAAQRETHARIAAVLEEQFPAIALARPDLVAHHLALADRRRRA